MDISPEKTTILVIDDDKDISQTLKGNLELDGYEVITAFDGKSGLAAATTGRPDLILLDLNLPDIDGITACRILRRDHDFPIIMLTARDGISDKVLGFECGADDYLIKPFNFLELSARIKAMLKRVARGQGEAPEPSPARIAMDLGSREVILRDRRIRLTRTEFELMELFVSHPGEALSREFIQEQIWRDSQLYQRSRALDVHVQRLRKKVEEDIEQPQLIVTVTGVGYRFDG